MIDKPCPWCNQTQPASVTRTAPGYAEWECSGCGKRWTVKDDSPGQTFAFWPPDVHAALDDNVQPLHISGVDPPTDPS